MTKKDIVSQLPKPELFSVKLKLHNINGEYAQKPYTYEDQIYDVTDIKRVTKLKKAGYQETKLDIDGETRDVLIRKVTRSAHAFPRNGLNQPLIPLGSPRGYLMGALIAIAKDVGVRQGMLLYGFLTWARNGGISIAPHFVASPAKTVKMADYWITEAKQKAFYEQIEETEVTVNFKIISRDGFNANLVKELLNRAEGIGISPKRRGWFEVVEFA